MIFRRLGLGGAGSVGAGCASTRGPTSTRSAAVVSLRLHGVDTTAFRASAFHLSPIGRLCSALDLTMKPFSVAIL